MFIKLKVYPDSKDSLIKKRAEDSYEVWVRSPAENGKANAEALKILAKALNKEPKQIHIVKGAKSPSKIIKIFD